MPPGWSRAPAASVPNTHGQHFQRVTLAALVLNRRNRRGKKKLTPIKKFVRNIRVRKREKLTKSL